MDICEVCKQPTQRSRMSRFVGADTAARFYAVRLNAQSRELLDRAAQSMAVAGGPDAPEVAAFAKRAAHLFRATLPQRDKDALERYRAGNLAAICFENAKPPRDDVMPLALPDRDIVEEDTAVLYLASRSQILLAAVEERAFAYNIENDGKIVRLVAAFEDSEPGATGAAAPHASSHHGGLLGPHTEGPYFTLRVAHEGHSPAPSSLALTARWNPLNEPTGVLDVRSILGQMVSIDVLGLSLPAFEFSRSDSYNSCAQTPNGVAIVEISEAGDLLLKFNALRVRLREDAPSISRNGLAALMREIESAVPRRYVLDARKVIIINNEQCVHSRDVIADRRRLLVRLFGYRADITANVLADDPLLVRG
jgi:hypothetical protein